MASYNADFLKKTHFLANPENTSDDVVNFYNTWARDYDKELTVYVEKVDHSLISNKLLEVYPERRDVRVLDLCAGTGFIGEELQKHGFTDMDALDANEEMLAKAKAKGIYKNIFQEFLGPDRLPIEDNTYDVCTIFGGFIPGHVSETCFEEVIRILKPGGYFIFTAAMVYLKLDLFKNFEPRIKELEAQGVWKCLCAETAESSRDIWEDGSRPRPERVIVLQTKL